MDRVPANHRLAERKLIALVNDGEWEIDDEGRIWRVAVRRGCKAGGSHLVPCARRRVEKLMPSGYMLVRAMRDGVRVVGLAHRLVWQAKNGDIPPGMTVNHRNGIRDDNRPKNLELGTSSDQMRHAHESGLVDQHGSKNPNAKLTDNEVARIRLAYQQGGYTMAQLAGRFGIAFQTVSKLVRGHRRRKQGGPVQDRDFRHNVSPRDPITGRFTRAGRLLDGREHSEWPFQGGPQ